MSSKCIKCYMCKRTNMLKGYIIHIEKLIDMGNNSYHQAYNLIMCIWDFPRRLIDKYDKVLCATCFNKLKNISS